MATYFLIQTVDISETIVSDPVKLTNYLFSLLSKSVVNKTDLQALNLSGTYCHKTSTGPSSCAKPRQPTVYEWSIRLEEYRFGARPIKTVKE